MFIDSETTEENGEHVKPNLVIAQTALRIKCTENSLLNDLHVVADVFYLVSFWCLVFWLCLCYVRLVFYIMTGIVALFISFWFRASYMSF